MPLTGFDIDLCAAASTPAGAGKLEYITVDALDLAEWEQAVLLAEWNQQKEIAASGWLTMPYVHGTGEWTEEQEQDEQGNYYRLSANCLLPADTPAVRGELSRMRQHRFLLRLTRSGQTYLLGTPEQPLRFESRFQSGADGGDQRGHRCTWRGVALQKSPGYVPVF